MGTPQVVASEFPRILERIQAKRELIQVLGEMDPNLFVELRSDKAMAELEDGSRDYLQDETELRASFCMDVVDGRVVSATTAPFLVVNYPLRLRAITIHTPPKRWGHASRWDGSIGWRSRSRR